MEGLDDGSLNGLQFGDLGLEKRPGKVGEGIRREAVNPYATAKTSFNELGEIRKEVRFRSANIGKTLR